MPVTIDFRANAAAFDAAVKQVDRGLEKQQQQLDKLKASSVKMSDAQAKAMQKVEGELKQQAKELENLQKSEQKSAAHKARAAARAEQLTKQQMASRRELQRLVREVHRDEVRGAREAQRAQREKARAIRRENEQMGREARQVWEQTATPLERYNAKVARLKQLLDAGKLSQDQYNRAVGQAKRKLDEAGRSGQDAFGPKAIGFAKQLAGALGIGAGVAGAVQLIRSEYEAMIEVQRTANQLSMTAAQAQESALTNLGATTEAGRDKFIQQVTRIAGDLGVSEAEVYKRASDALSARGDQPVSAAMQAVRSSFAFAPGDTAAGIAASGAALDIGAVTGATAPESLGYLQAVGQRARITDPRKLAVNLPPALRASMANGANARTAGALFAAMTQGMADPTGESSRTATISFAQQLRNFEGGPAWAGLSMRERIGRLQSDAEMRRQFLESASFEKRAQAPVEELLSGGSTAKAFAQFRQGLPGMEEAGELFRQASAVKSGAGLQKVARFTRALKGAKEALATGDPEGAMLGALREEFQPLLKQAGMPKITAQFAELTTFDGGVEPFIDTIRQQASQLTVPKKQFLVSPGGSMTDVTPKVTEETRRQADILTQLAGLLEQIAENTNTRQPTLVPAGEDR